MNDDRVDEYLFDPTAPPAGEVRELEEILAPLRYDPMRRPLRGRRVPYLAMAAAALIALVGVGAWFWTWPAGRAWKVVSGPMATLPVGRTIQPGQSLLVRVARIGWMSVTERSIVTLLSTRSNRHRLSMTAGTLHVSVWAPPGSVNIRTPAGEVIDLGCEFIVRADRSTTSVDVVSGWVELENGSGEVLVPGGASSEMHRSGFPAPPVFRSATAEFQVAARNLDVPTLVRTARRRDVLTLLVIASRRPPGRDALLVRAAELMPPHSEETLLRARAGDNDAIWAWVHELPLPPAKSWIRNWRDRLGGQVFS